MTESWLAEFGALPHEPMSRHSQYGIGGPADWFVQLDDDALLAELLRRTHDAGLPVSVIGAGSNTLILDGGIRGVVVELTAKRWEMSGDTALTASAGMMMPRLALDCARQGIAGLEFGIGVPGTVGASVRGNAGAFGTEICDVLLRCEVLDARGERRALDAADCGFAYRTSVFKRALPHDIVVSATFAVTRDDPADVRRRTDAIQAQRKATQPYGIRSLGSMFTNPSGDHAGRLIEAAGLKGTRHGGAEISPKHANFVVNTGKATAADVLALAALAHDRVLQKFGVDLEREIVVMGEDATVTTGGNS